ncbi:MAG: iron-containing alcohol dehydrogenase [Candidatus Hermodarchaeota archaeon]
MINKKLMVKRIYNNPEVFYRKGAVSVLKHIEYEKILLLVSNTVRNSEYFQKIQSYLSAKSVQEEIIKIPSQEAIQNLKKKYLNDIPEVIVAIGGGKVLDSAKILKVLLDNPSLTFTELEANQFSENNKIKLVAVPTTPGTGSEVTSVSVLIDKEGRKIPYVNKGFLPDLAILDHTFLETIETRALFEFAADIFSHACEGQVSMVSSPLIKSISKSCLELLNSGIAKIKEDLKNTEGLAEIMYAGHLGGIVQGNAFVGAIHALSHALEQLFKISHASAILTVLKPTILWLKNVKYLADYDEFLNIYEKIGFERFKKSDFLEKIEKERWADIALQDPSISTSPVRMKKENLMDLINFILKETSGHVFKPNINEIISQEQYKLTQKEKNKLLLPILIDQIKQNINFSPILKEFYLSMGRNPDYYFNLYDIPPIPVSMFKSFDLKTCPESEISRILKSSATTTGIPSKIFINKETAFRQSRALISILKNFLGGKRRPVLVIDTENINLPNSDSLTARGAAIRGISNFAKKIVYVLDEVDGELHLNFDKLNKFCEEFSDQEIIVSGFTYIIWTHFVKEVMNAGIKLDIPKMKLIHSGGWKKLTAQAVDKQTFSTTLADIFNTKSENIIDFYGMVEQLGVIFLDCEQGYKHVPDFAEVIISDFYSMKQTPIGQPGLIEILSLIPTSYPGQAIITEDMGELVGVDDCLCGRKGKYFRFLSRVERTETRGCGDTFAEKRGDI